MFEIVDPVNPSNNTARNSYKTQEIQDHFKRVFTLLKNKIWLEFSERLMAKHDEERESRFEKLNLVEILFSDKDESICDVQIDSGSKTAESLGRKSEPSIAKYSPE